MLEKIGLPAKPSLRGNNWVVDSSHCQGCSSQFTFINRKHHCRRCGGLFCNSCSQQRMVLRGQGDSPVRICEPCKKLEEAARFELRHGHRSRAGRGSMKLTSKYEDEVLNQILGNDGKESFSSGRESTIDTVSSIQRATSSASCSNIQEVATQDQGEEILRSLSVGESHVLSEMGSATSEELRQQALDEKKKYKILKGEGKSEEALRAFKRGKELERQAGALEIFLRKSRKKAVSSSNVAEIQNTQDDFKESGRKNKLFPQMGKEKDDLAAELRELGWSDMDLRDPDRKPATMSLEGELSTLLGDISQKTGIDKETHGIDKTQVIAHKKKALVLKREGKLTEAKEELKRAKVLEKQLEEQEFLADAEDSDDELSSLIRSMDIDKQDDLSIGYDPEPAFDFNRLVGIPDDLGVDSNFEVTEEDMDDPEIAAALESLGWTEDSNYPVDIVPQFVPIDKEAVLREIHSLKREALNQKRVGNVAEALAQLKKAKVLERDLGSIDSQGNNSVAHLPAMIRKDSISQTDEKLSESNKVDGGNVNAMKGVDSKLATKSKLMIQKELLGLKKKALALRREGRLDEAEEELKKGKVLEQQLEEMDNASKLKVAQANFNNKDSELAYGHPDISRTLAFEDEGEEGDVTDQDMHDQTYLSLLRNLGWKDEDHESIKFPSKPSKQNDLSVQITDYPVTRAPSSIPVGESRKTKAEIQRELLRLKRKALALRRQGEVEEAEEVLRMAKLLEAQLAEMEAAKKEGPDDFAKHKEDDIIKPPFSSSVAGGDDKDVTERDTSDPTLLSMLKNLGWKDEEVEPVSMQAKPSMRVAGHSLHSTDPSVIESSTGTPVVTKRRSKGEIQRELLGLKRKALALRRQGETEEAEEVLRMADVLAAQMEEVEAPKEELLLDVPKDKVPESCGSSISQEKNGSLKAVKESNQGSVGPNDKVAEGSIGSDTAKPLPRSSDISIPETSQLIEDNSPLIAELGPPAEKRTAESTGFFPPSGQSVNLMDLLTGDDWKSSQIPVEEVEDSRKFSSGISSLGNPPIQLRSLKSPNEELENKDDVEKRKEMVLAATHEANSAQASVSHYNQSSLRQEILAHKRKAVALKREGKLAEAREELRQAKLLEKSLGEDNPHSDTKPSEVSVSTSNVTSVAQKVQDSSNLAPKPMSGRDRFKLQQESLSHKRHALKLRREGRVEEAEAEFELAKALEAQLEELTARDSVNPNKSVNEAELVDDVGVEDLLDPQLLSALKAIGLQDANVVSRDPERPEPVKQSAVKSGNSSHERIQLEERIKVEKVKAVNLKRSGKQAEALDALRRAKQFEKKLNSLASQ